MYKNGENKEHSMDIADASEDGDDVAAGDWDAAILAVNDLDGYDFDAYRRLRDYDMSQGDCSLRQF